ncbi:MAG: hypothetical protein ACKVOJ_07440 [Sphingomonadaceae bacterium]
MHMISSLFFLAALGLAFGVIHTMLASHADKIIAALQGNHGVRDQVVHLSDFGHIRSARRDAINDNVSLPVAA